jgi:hypothetical protein
MCALTLKIKEHDKRTSSAAELPPAFKPLHLGADNKGNGGRNARCARRRRIFSCRLRKAPMSQARPRHYLGALRAAQAAAKATNAARVAAYHVLPKGISCKADWMGWNDPWYNATPRQQALLDVLQDLLDGGETGMPMIALKIALRLEIAEADILRSRDNVDADGETGYFFDDVVHALFALDAQQTEQVFYGLIDRLVQPGSVNASLSVR